MATAWRDLPEGTVEPQLADLRPASRRTYIKSLARFSCWCTASGISLRTLNDLDRASYRYLSVCTRSQGEALLSALLKCYPMTRNQLPWTRSRVTSLGAANPPEHHPPMIWHIVLDIAYYWCQAGRPRRAGLLLLTWRLGLRPSEGVDLLGSDLYLGSVDPAGQRFSFVRLGYARGTKVRRPQVARVPQWDWIAAYLVWLFQRSTPPNSRLSDVSDYRIFAATVRTGLQMAGHAPDYTPHSLRAGWATWRFMLGQPVPEMMLDGRWRSEAALRTYLDATAAAEAAETPLIRGRQQWYTHLEATLLAWLRW